MFRFSLFGIPVTVQPFFWVTMALISGERGEDSTSIFRMALFIIAGLISILVHEMGHALTVKAFGAPTSITLEAFGGFATHPQGMLNRKQRFLVTAGGPAAQLLLALLAIAPLVLFTEKLLMPAAAGNHDLLMRILRSPFSLTKEYHGAYFLGVLGLISVFWAVLNLLPALPLDGGQLVNSALGPARIRTTLWITIISGIVGALVLFFYFHFMIFPLMLGYFAFQAFQALREDKQGWSPK